MVGASAAKAEPEKRPSVARSRAKVFISECWQEAEPLAKPKLNREAPPSPPRAGRGIEGEVSKFGPAISQPSTFNSQLSLSRVAHMIAPRPIAIGVVPRHPQLVSHPHRQRPHAHHRHRCARGRARQLKTKWAALEALVGNPTQFLPLCVLASLRLCVSCGF